MNIIEERKEKILLKAIDDFELDLSGLEVFTEIASGNYLYTSIASFLAGAEKTYGIVKDSIYASKEEVINDFFEITKHLDIKDKIIITSEKNEEFISRSDIITNSGFVRPINIEDISHMKSTTVIPLMFESWEFDSSHIDLECCKKKEVMVIGTNEHYHLLDLFSTFPYKICKMLFDANMSIYNDNILLVSSGEIGDLISEFFSVNNINFDRISFEFPLNIQNFDLSIYDAIIIAELYFKKINILSKNGFISTKKLKKDNPLIQVIHSYGLVNKKDIYEENISIFPNIGGNVTGDYLSPEITIRLNVASLKVAEIVSRYRLKGKTVEETLDIISKNNLVDIGIYKKQTGQHIKKKKLMIY